MRKGQIFTLDVLMALVAVTVVLGYMTWQFEQVYSKSHDIEYEKIYMLSNDISQIAVKNTLAKTDKPNNIDTLKIIDLKAEIDAIIKPPYYYEVLFPVDTLSLNTGVCDEKLNIAVSTRLTTEGEITIKVCI